MNLKISDILKLLIEDNKFSDILKKYNLENKKNDIEKQILSLNVNTNLDTDEIFVYSDGAVSGNPGIGGIGCVIFDKNKNELAAENEFIDYATNNIAEYKALLLSLDILKDLNLYEKKINFFADSELMVKQIKGEYKISNEELKNLCSIFFDGIKKFKNYTIRHIPREKNKIADNLAVLAKNKKLIKRRIK